MLHQRRHRGGLEFLKCYLSPHVEILLSRDGRVFGATVLKLFDALNDLLAISLNEKRDRKALFGDFVVV